VSFWCLLRGRFQFSPPGRVRPRVGFRPVFTCVPEEATGQDTGRIAYMGPPLCYYPIRLDLEVILSSVILACSSPRLRIKKPPLFAFLQAARRMVRFSAHGREVEHRPAAHLSFASLFPLNAPSPPCCSVNSGIFSPAMLLTPEALRVFLSFIVSSGACTPGSHSLRVVPLCSRHYQAKRPKPP